MTVSCPTTSSTTENSATSVSTSGSGGSSSSSSSDTTSSPSTAPVDAKTESASGESMNKSSEFLSPGLLLYAIAGAGAVAVMCIVAAVFRFCRQAATKTAKVTPVQMLESGQMPTMPMPTAAAPQPGQMLQQYDVAPPLAWTGSRSIQDVDDVEDGLVESLAAACGALTGADLIIPAEALELEAVMFENTFMAGVSSATIDGFLSAGQAVPAIGALFTVLVEMKRHLDRFVKFEDECKRLSIWCVSQIGTLGHLGRGSIIDVGTAKLLRAAIPPLLDLKALVVSRLEASKGFLGRMMAFWMSAEYLTKSDLAQKRVLAAIDALMTRVQVNTQIDVQKVLKKCEMLPAMDKKLDAISSKVDQVLLNQQKDLQQQQHFQEEMLAKRAKQAKGDYVRERRSANTDRYNISAAECMIVAELGRGANATVFKAKWQGQDVAIKKINMEGMSMNERNARQASFLTETDILIQLRHPNILAVYGVITEDSRSLQHVLEFATHGDLRQFLNFNATGDKEQPHEPSCGALQPLSRVIQLDLSAQVARGMAVCHKMKCAHRDLKSLNILANSDISKPSALILKISDFGESKDVDAQTASTIKTLGTPAWTAPEILRGQKEVDLYSADVWSYGVILYEVATLQMPWHGLDGLQIAVQVVAMKKTLEMPGSTIPTLLQVFRGCLAEPANRPTFLTIQQTVDAALLSEECRLAEEAQSKAVSRTDDVIRREQIDAHMQALQKYQDAQKVEIMRREEELQRKQRERSRKQRERPSNR